MRRNNICHITGAPCHPQTNGLAERCVKSFKRSFSKLLKTNNDNESIQTLVSRLLRTESHRILLQGVSPAELLMGRKLNNALSAKKLSTGRKHRIRNELIRVSDKMLRRFESGDLIWVRNYANGRKWIKGIVERELRPVLYELNARGCLIQRHVDQIRLRVDDHTPDDSNEIIPVNKEPVVPPMLPTNTEESIPNKLVKNLPPVSTASSVHPSVTSPLAKDNAHLATPELVDHSSNSNLDVRNGIDDSIDSSTETLFRRSARITRRN